MIRNAAFLIGFFFLTTSIFAQKKIEFYKLDLHDGLYFVPNTIDPYTGMAFEKHSNDVDKINVPIKNGKIHGTVKEWAKNEEKTLEINYENGVLEGMERQWYATGDQKLEVMYVKGNFEGPFREWHKNEVKKSEGIFRAGKEEGEHKWWYPNGQLDQIVTFKNGLEEGLIRSWYEGGAKYVEANYLAGEKHGKLTEWFENGQKQSEANFKNGKEDGNVFYWSKAGLILREQTFDNGTLIEDKNYRSGNIRVHEGYVQVINTRESFFHVGIYGDPVRAVSNTTDVTFAFEGKLLQFFNQATSNFLKTTSASDEETLEAYVKFESDFIRSQTEFDIQVNSEIKTNAKGQKMIYWHFVSPSSKDEVQKPRTVQEEHYISLVCNKQILDIYGVVTNSETTEEVKQMLFKIADQVRIEKERIDLNGLSQKLTAGK